MNFFAFFILSLLTGIYFVLFCRCFLYLFIYLPVNLSLGTFFGDLPVPGAVVCVGNRACNNNYYYRHVNNSSVGSTAFSPTGACLLELLSDQPWRE
jgi:hypothetical protein